jgi:hypothetical protein
VNVVRKFSFKKPCDFLRLSVFERLLLGFGRQKLFFAKGISSSKRKCCQTLVDACPSKTFLFFCFRRLSLPLTIFRVVFWKVRVLQNAFFLSLWKKKGFSCCQKKRRKQFHLFFFLVILQQLQLLLFRSKQNKKGLENSLYSWRTDSLPGGRWAGRVTKKKRVGSDPKTISQVSLDSQNIFWGQIAKTLSGTDENISSPGWGDRQEKQRCI